MPPLDPSVQNGSLATMMKAQASQPGDMSDSDDGSTVTCPSCGATFGVNKQTTYEAGPVVSQPGDSSSGQVAGIPSGQ